MNRAEALVLAREHVEKMSTNHRGYQDGVNLAGKVAAVETFARFLMEGEPVAEPVAEIAIHPRHEMTSARRALLVHLANWQVDTGPQAYDDAARALLDELGAL